MRSLTSRQNEILGHIRKFLDDDNPPTIAELCEAVGMDSTNGIHEQLINIEHKGFITRNSKSRSIRLTLKGQIDTEPSGFAFMVLGKPEPQGSKESYSGKVDSNKNLGDWRDAVHWAAVNAKNRSNMKRFEGGVRVTYVFALERPKSHYVNNNPENKLKASAPIFHVKVPDFDKLMRAVNDSMTSAGIWKDDSQVCQLGKDSEKIWVPFGSGQAGAYIVVAEAA